ncbi:MAG: hypothetical protein EOL87_07350 [Spartobacteria bacterium]|nr:hypothetical protein [Spartobacteria bacterium]
MRRSIISEISVIGGEMPWSAGTTTIGGGTALLGADNEERGGGTFLTRQAGINLRNLRNLGQKVQAGPAFLRQCSSTQVPNDWKLRHAWVLRRCCASVMQCRRSSADYADFAD